MEQTDAQHSGKRARAACCEVSTVVASDEARAMAGPPDRDTPGTHGGSSHPFSYAIVAHRKPGQSAAGPRLPGNRLYLRTLRLLI